MDEVKRPVRLQLSRKKGFDLQSASLAINGLAAVNVARPSKWSNPFVMHHPGSSIAQPMSQEMAVASFRSMLKKEGAWWPIPIPWPKGKIPACEPTTVEDVRRELAGKNLACWCARSPCHADVLIELANGPLLSTPVEVDG